MAWGLVWREGGGGMSTYIAPKDQADAVTARAGELFDFATLNMCEHFQMSSISAMAVLVQVAILDLHSIGGDAAWPFVTASIARASAKTDREKKKGMAAMSEAFSRMVSVFEAQVELQRAGGMQ